jgi:hypothetical protein
MSAGIESIEYLQEGKWGIDGNGKRKGSHESHTITETGAAGE